MTLRKEYLMVVAMIIIAAVLIIGTVWSLSSAVKAADAEETTAVAVQEGDTLWSIADTLEGDPRKIVFEIRKLNGIEDPSQIRPGDILIVPAQGR